MIFTVVFLHDNTFKAENQSANALSVPWPDEHHVLEPFPEKWPRSVPLHGPQQRAELVTQNVPGMFPNAYQSYNLSQKDMLL